MRRAIQSEARDGIRQVGRVLQAKGHSYEPVMPVAVAASAIVPSVAHERR
jgi:hypothetical protein